MRNTKIIQMITAVMVINLQLFADAGTNVNTSVGYVNSNTGAVRPFDAQHTMDPEMKTFYDTTLLENARVGMVYGQFAVKQPLPKNGGRTVEWRKANTFDKATKLQEGVIPTGQDFGFTSITASIEQYGTFTAVSDVLELHAYDDVIMAATEEMGASAAETSEALIRDALLANTNVYYCHNVDMETGKVVGSQPTSCAEMEASEAVACCLTPKDIAKIRTIMTKNKAKPINGLFVGVAHPSVVHDLTLHPDFIEVHKYAQPEEIFRGEIGKIHGCRFIENVFAPVLGGEDYTNKAGTVTYATYFFGKDAFGIIDPDGGSMETIVKDKSQIGGPLNQFSTIGYKLETNGATVLYPERVLRCMSCSSMSAEDEAN